MNPNTHPPIDLLGLPFFWQEGVLSRVHLGENVLAWLEVDLNDELSFKKTLLILTDQRVISADEAQNNWNFWTLAPDFALRVLDHAGVGTLALYQGGNGWGPGVSRWGLRQPFSGGNCALKTICWVRFRRPLFRANLRRLILLMI